MTIFRNEIRTGLLVVITLVALISLLIYLGAPGIFVAQKTFRIYFDNASGLEPGAPVLLAGRRIGQVTGLHSPVSEQDRPDPTLETMVEVKVDKSAKIFTKVRAQMTLPSLLGKPVIDFTSGEEASGLAPENNAFIGERQPGLSDAVPSILEKIDPALVKATATFESLQKVADNLANLTDEEAELPKVLTEFRMFGSKLNELSGPDSSLRRSLANIEMMTGDDSKIANVLEQLSTLTGPEGDLAKSMANAKTFTAKLATNEDLSPALRSMRQASENLNRQVTNLGGKFSSVGDNLEQASDTVKRQPWRLIWPTTKKYPADQTPEANLQPKTKDTKPSTPAPAHRSIFRSKSPLR